MRGDRLVHHLRVLMAVCRAIELAHDRGFLHRDIKLANVMLGRFGEVYLLDFGLAISLEEARSCRIEAIQGTPQYMAPEMLDPERPLDERADVYLLGATLHHVLTGRPRHGGESYGAVLFAAATSAPCTHGDDVPAELAAICQRATHADPAARYPSARALREALEDYLAHRDSIELTDAARQRLDELREAIASDGDPVRIEALLREARFGFEQALRGWSDNAGAKDGLRQALEEMLAHHLGEGHREGARALASELDPLPDGARERLDELERERARERDASARLAQVEHAFDERVGQRERRITAWLVGGLILVSGGMSLVAWALGFEVLEREMLVAGTFIVNALLFTAAVVFRRPLMSNRYNRTMALVLGSGTVGVLLNRVEGYLLDESFASILASDGILMAVVFAVAGALLRRAFLVGTVTFLTVSLVTGLFPAYALPSLAAGGIITILAILLARGSAREPLLGRPSSDPREPSSEGSER